MREVRTIGRTFDAKVYVYAECKYKADTEVLENSKEVEYNGIESWEIISGEDAREIEEQGLVDDYNEYLVLNFENGDTATFRNSYVDMHRIFGR